MSRLKPYCSNETNILQILSMTMGIPMNQRKYKWTEEQVRVFVDDIIQIFTAGKYIERMGSIITLNYENNNDIYEGQQRILTTALLLNVLGTLSDVVKESLKTVLIINELLYPLSKEKAELKKKYNAEKFPKIYCVSPSDMEALLLIYNNKVIPWSGFLSDKDNKEEKYVCNVCNEIKSRKTDFIKHLVKKHDYISYDNNKNSNLYESYIFMYTYILSKRYSEDEIKDLYKFIMNDIEIQHIKCSDPKYVSQLFEWENNRGLEIEPLDIIKNPIMVSMPEDVRYIVYDRWENLKEKKPNNFKNKFSMKLFDTAIQLYSRNTNKINRTIKNEELYAEIINSDNPYREIQKFFQIIDKLYEILENISLDRYGKLILSSQKITLGTDVYIYSLLPIFYTIDRIDSELLLLMVKWYFRHIVLKNQTLSSFCYSTEFERITNSLLQNTNYDYIKEIKECLNNNLDISLKDNNYIEQLTNYSFNTKQIQATYILLFLEVMINTDLCNTSMEYTNEHIICQNKKNDLKNIKSLNNIGNITLYEGKNSSNGHKGNSSLGIKPYDYKKIYYKDSSSKITRMLYENFPSFEEEQIYERSKIIAELLNKHTKF
jgi:hypothetical protein